MMSRRVGVFRRGDCAVLLMNNGENKVTTEFISSFHHMLDRVQRYVVNLTG